MRYQDNEDEDIILTAAVTTSGDFPLNTTVTGTFSLLYDVTGESR